MKIALLQLDANDKLWSPEYIPELLIASSGADLVVFPELMPFDKAGRTPYQSIKPARHSVPVQLWIVRLSREVMFAKARPCVMPYFWPMTKQYTAPILSAFAGNKNLFESAKEVSALPGNRVLPVFR